MTSNVEIYRSYLCDQILAACNRINEKLDVMAEQVGLFTYTDSYVPLQYSAPAYVTPGQTTAEPYFHNQSPLWQTPPPPQPYFNNQPTPSNDYHQSLQLSFQQPLVTAAPPHQNYPQLPPPNTYQPQPPTSPTTYQQPLLTSAATATSLVHHHQPQPPNTHQPPTPPYVPPRQTMAAPTAQFHSYPQPPLHYLQQRPQSYRQPPLTAAATASLPNQNYQPDGHKPCTGKPQLGWPPPSPQHSLSDWSLPSHGRSAAPLPAAAVVISKGKTNSSLSGLNLIGRFDREQGNFNSVYGPRMEVHEGEGSDSSILDAQIDYSCDEAKNFACSSSSSASYDGAEASVDLHICYIAGMNYRLALLDADARLIPPRMDTRCLSISGRVDKIPILALNYHEPTSVIFVGDNEGRRSVVRCAFDPGGDRSRLAYVISDFASSCSHLEDKVNFNRGGVDTVISSGISSGISPISLLLYYHIFSISLISC